MIIYTYSFFFSYKLTYMAMALRFAPKLKAPHQPSRFSSRRSAELLPLCVSAANAAEYFKNYVCMTTNGWDADFTEKSASVTSATVSEKDILAEVNKLLKVSEDDEKYISGGIQYGIVRTSSKTYGIFTVSNAGLELANNKFVCPINFRAFKLSTPGHISIALWDILKNTVEVFDASGEDETQEMMQRAMLDKLFSATDPKPDFFWVNETNLQVKKSGADNDEFCQTWIYLYLYCRTVQKKPWTTTIYEFEELTPNERFQKVARFWHWLMR